MAESLDVDSFVAQFNGGGARPNLYKITLNFPSIVPNVGDAQKRSMLCKAASLPQSTIGVVPVPYMGRQIKVAGDKEFPDWTVTMFNDTDFDTRRAFETWLAAINSHVSNVGVSNPLMYYADLKIEQLNKLGNIIYTYNMYNCFPLEVGEITLGYDQNDQIEEFTVTFSLNYWTSDGAL
jgi:hypothetical protein